MGAATALLATPSVKSAVQQSARGAGVLLDEEVRGRDEATRAMRRKAAGFPAGKTLASWREQD